MWVVVYGHDRHVRDAELKRDMKSFFLCELCVVAWLGLVVNSGNMARKGCGDLYREPLCFSDSCGVFALRSSWEVLQFWRDSHIASRLYKNLSKLFEKKDMGCGSSKASKCYLELAVNGGVIGRLVIELRSDKVPKTAENFRALCTGENGNSYAGSSIHRIVPGFIAQGGECGKSIYGKKFEDENFKILHKGKGVLSMANTGPHSNGTQFFISLGDCSELDGKHVVFGKVVEGKEILDALNDLGSSEGTTKSPVTIVSCGEC